MHISDAHIEFDNTATLLSRNRNSKTVFGFRGVVKSSEHYFIFTGGMYIASGWIMVGKPGARLKRRPLMTSFYSTNRDTIFDGF